MTMNNQLCTCAILLLCIFTACKKDNGSDINRTTTTVNVINAAVNVTGVKVNTNNAPVTYLTASQVSYGASALFFLQKPSANLSIVASSDTSNYLLNKTLAFNAGLVTIYIAGQSGTVDTLIREEQNYPFIRTDVITPDSSINLRFVNLSPNSAGVTINIKGSSTNETSNLPYKGITNFKSYTAKSTNTSYVFEIRDASASTLLFTYTFSVTATNRFKNVALIIKGLQGTTTGTNAFGVFPANYF